MIHQPLSQGSSLNHFVPQIVSPLPCSSRLGRHKLLFAYFFKKLISFIGSLNKCHTGVYNALIVFVKYSKLGTDISLHLAMQPGI